MSIAPETNLTKALDEVRQNRQNEDNFVIDPSILKNRQSSKAANKSIDMRAAMRMPNAAKQRE